MHTKEFFLCGRDRKVPACRQRFVAGNDQVTNVVFSSSMADYHQRRHSYELNVKFYLGPPSSIVGVVALEQSCNVTKYVTLPRKEVADLAASD